jgi:hypothetical protein
MCAVIPVSFTQDSVGPMARYVADVALLLGALAGPDPRDAYTLHQPTPVPDYVALLSPEALLGARIGVPRALIAPPEKLESDMQAFEDALRTLQMLGAELVDDVGMPAVLGLGERFGLLPSELRVLETEFRVGPLPVNGKTLLKPAYSRVSRNMSESCARSPPASERLKTSSHSTKSTPTKSLFLRTTHRRAGHCARH